MRDWPEAGAITAARAKRIGVWIGMRFLSLVVVLFAFWLLLSGHYTPFLVIAGLLTALAAAVVGRVLGFGDAEGYPIELTASALLYWPWLIKEILFSAINVASIILRPSLPISPQLISVPTSQKGPVGLVTYANSITLTPGTITVQVDRPHHTFLVHALTKGSADGLASGEMDRRVTNMAGPV